jgi:hypothetical protein
MLCMYVVSRYGYLDPYVNVTGRPSFPLYNNWTYIRSDSSWYHPLVKKPFLAGTIPWYCNHS